MEVTIEHLSHKAVDHLGVCSSKGLLQTEVEVQRLRQWVGGQATEEFECAQGLIPFGALTDLAMLLKCGVAELLTKTLSART